MKSTPQLNLRREVVLTVLALLALAAALAAVTWLAKRPSTFLHGLRDVGWFVWPVCAIAAWLRLKRRQRSQRSETPGLAHD